MYDQSNNNIVDAATTFADAAFSKGVIRCPGRLSKLFSNFVVKYTESNLKSNAYGNQSSKPSLNYKGFSVEDIESFNNNFNATYNNEFSIIKLLDSLCSVIETLADFAGSIAHKACDFFDDNIYPVFNLDNKTADDSFDHPFFDF